jgi:hypothetical protein
VATPEMRKESFRYFHSLCLQEVSRGIRIVSRLNEGTIRGTI